MYHHQKLRSLNVHWRWFPTEPRRTNHPEAFREGPSEGDNARARVPANRASLPRLGRAAPPACRRFGHRDIRTADAYLRRVPSQ